MYHKQNNKMSTVPLYTNSYFEGRAEKDLDEIKMYDEGLNF